MAATTRFGDLYAVWREDFFAPCGALATPQSQGLSQPRPSDVAQGAAAAARAAPTSAGAMGALAVAEQALGGSLGRLMAVAENYPDLKADATMQSLSEELTSTENRLGFARQAYNDLVLDFNDQAAQFPAIVVARLLGFPTAPMLEATHSDDERAAPRVQF